MTGIERLRTTGHPGREAARFSQACAAREEAQSRLRRKMRIHPPARKPPVKLFVGVGEKSAVHPRPIVTVNGKDLPPEQTKAPEEQLA